MFPVHHAGGDAAAQAHRWHRSAAPAAHVRPVSGVFTSYVWLDQGSYPSRSCTTLPSRSASPALAATSHRHVVGVEYQPARFVYEIAIGGGGSLLVAGEARHHPAWPTVCGASPVCSGTARLLHRRATSRCGRRAQAATQPLLEPFGSRDEQREDLRARTTASPDARRRSRPRRCRLRWEGCPSKRGERRHQRKRKPVDLCACALRSHRESRSSWIAFFSTHG